MSSRLPRDEALEKEDRIDQMKKNNQKTAQSQQAPALPYAKVVGCPSTGSYPAPLPDPTTHPEREVTRTKKKIWVSYFSMRNPYMKFQNPSIHGS